jgi:putative DNA primase/helicase
VDDITFFNRLAGDVAIQADRKYSQPFRFKNRALVYFSANTVPPVGDNAQAYFTRVKPFFFQRSYAGKETPVYEDQMMQELPGILVRWVKAYQEREKRGNYLPTNPQVQEDFMNRSERVRMHTKLKATIHRECPTGEPVTPGKTLPDAWVTTQRECFRTYALWARQNNYGMLSEQKYYDRLFAISGVTKGVRMRGRNEG